jgi:CheY-like chemotaxis protein
MADPPIKLKILVIEDNIVNAKLLTIYLEEAGFEVIHAIDGYTGLHIVRTERGISGILLDRIMPDMDGLDALRDIKLGPSRHIPVIMLTSALSTKQITDAKIIGAHACLRKPYNKEQIISTLKEALTVKRKPQESKEP